MDKKILVIDVGNSNIVAGVYWNDELLCDWRLKSDTLKTADEYYCNLKLLVENSNLNLLELNSLVISSVVPDLTTIFTQLADKYLKCRIINVSGYTDIGLTFPVSDPGFIGADLIVNAFAAWKKYNDNCIVLDLGTATTIQLIGKDGYFFGTAIIPGIMIAAGSLFSKASLLSNIKFSATDILLGTNTKDALLAGIITGNTLMLDAFIKKLKSKYGYLQTFKTIATGGIAGMICQNSEEVDVIDPTLTLYGLKLISDLFSK
ncbi:MAG: type III pantothenate kinase [Candidatus Cloacimonetes bacterium]|nr:type III pantothenate kinase [Candidatus Cloacimonadota bacterium]